ncbi:BTAD domain-containing putative transcriptional regulator [Arthrobacter oryzae]|uniref:Response regulator n=1 Tax=Arthrobacter oryzae TaxID=409290 RepID=A0A3N0BSE3_9MICC|nr:BTAD domain-containing putative transcriptional regulator [Arthrobacter oryzae]RNL52024.1 response regulator [Arthrobacter oryzae]
MSVDPMQAAARGAVTDQEMPSPEMLYVTILGSLRIRRGDSTLGGSELGGPKPRQILEILLMNFGNPLSKERLVETLWEGQPPMEALPTLESYVSVLRRHLQPGRGKSGPLRTVTGGYMIDPDLVDLDLARFNALLQQATHCVPRAALELLQEALDMAAAPLLGDELKASWAENERANHELRVSRARTDAADLALALKEPDRAVAWAREILSGDPLNERAWAALVRGLDESGQPLEGLRAFEQCRRTLDREMGCSPGEALRAAHASLLRQTGDPVLPAPARATVAGFPPAATAAGTAGIRILTVDDHRTFTELLTGALDREADLQSVGSAFSVATAIRLCRELAPDVVVMDYHLPDGNGLTASVRILEHAPDTRIIMLTGDPSQDVLRQAAGIGICGFLPKDGSLATMLDTVRHARTGNLVVHPSLVAQLGIPQGRTAHVPPNPLLSPRELDVLRLMADGQELRSVAKSLGISVHTCRGYVRTIFSKLGSHSPREAMAEAELRGILSVELDVQAV